MLVYYSVLMILTFSLFALKKMFKEKKYRMVGCVFAAIVLVCVSGLRYKVGTDYERYMSNYFLYLNNDLSLLHQPGVNIVARISSIIFDDYATWFFIMAIIAIVPVMHTIHKQSVAIGLSIVLFMFVGCWHGSFNLVKQSAALAILFAGYQYLLNRNFKKWVAICIVACMFHVSALLMIPVYFVSKPKVSRRNTALIIGVGLCVFFSYDILLQVMSILKDSSLRMNSRHIVNGVSLFRVLVQFIPVLLCVIRRRSLEWQNEQFAFLFNLSLFNASISFGAMNSIYLTRFCFYTQIVNVLFLPRIFNALIKRHERWIVVITMILYFVFWSYDLYKGSSTVNFYWIFER